MTKPPKCTACNGQGFTRWKGEDGACDICKGSGELFLDESDPENPISIRHSNQEVKEMNRNRDLKPSSH